MASPSPRPSETLSRPGSSPAPSRTPGYSHSPHNRNVVGDLALGTNDPYALIEVHAPPANKPASITIIAVPGSTGDPFESWKLSFKKKMHGSRTPEKQSFNWLTQGLAQEEDFKHARIFAFKFPKIADDMWGQMAGPPWATAPKGEPTSKPPSLREISNHLATELALKHTDSSPVVFIAISFGGLVVKELLATRPPEVINLVSTDCVGIMFFGTPHRGLSDSQIHQAGPFFRRQHMGPPGPKGNLIKWYIEQTEDLRSLDESFRFQFHELDIVSLYETQPTRTIERVLVDARAATLGTENERVIPINKDHGTLCRFSDREDEYYKIVVTELRRMQRRYAGFKTPRRDLTEHRMQSEPEITRIPAQLPTSPPITFSSPAPVPLAPTGQSKVPRDMLDKSYVRVDIQEFYVSTTIYDKRSPRLPAASSSLPGGPDSSTATTMERNPSLPGTRGSRGRGNHVEVEEVTLPGESRNAPITTMLEVGPRNWYKMRGEESDELDDEEQTEGSEEVETRLDSIGSLQTVMEALNQRLSRGGRTTVDYFAWIHVPLNVMAFAAPVLKVLCDEQRIPFRILDDPIWRLKHRKSRGKQPFIHSHFMEYSSQVKLVRFQERMNQAQVQGQGEPTLPGSTSGARDVPDLTLDNPPSSNDSADEGPMQDRVVAQMAIYLPYLHWDTFRCFAQRDKVYKRLAAGERNLFLEVRDPPIDRTTYKIAEDYLDNADLPVHIRRTLDQFFYTYLPDTSKRDFDQRIAHQTKGSRGGPKMVMCDQAWIFVLDSNTLATFFTPKEKENIDTDILLDADLKLGIGNKTNEEENFKSRNAYEMAASVIEAAVSVLFNGSRTSSLKFLEIYREVIGKAAEDQTSFFTNFRDQLNEDIKSGGRRMSISEEDFQNEDTAQKRTELSLALKVADTIDELNSILRLLDAQQEVVRAVKEDMRTVQRTVRVNVGNAFTTLDNALGHINDYKRQIRRLISDASRTQKGVLNLLDLKQKEASIEEARVARWLQQDTHKLQLNSQEQGFEMEKQGRTILIFITVTIVFLPLSFFTSFFGQNVTEYTGDSANPSLQHVWAYGGPITAACIVLAFATAYYSQIMDSFRRTRTFLKPRKKSPGKVDEDLRSDREPILPVAQSSLKKNEGDLLNRYGRIQANDSGPLIYENWEGDEEHADSRL